MTNLRQEAKGRECQIRIPGVCKNDRSTVVLCHTNETRAAGAGMGLKPHDLLAFYACHECHAVADGRVYSGYDFKERRLMEYPAVIRTLMILIDEEKIGVIT